MAYWVKHRNEYQLVEKKGGKPFYLMTLGKDPMVFMKDEKIATPVLALALEHQTARVASNATLVANFTEGWFQKF